ncbi:MAG: NAD-dependent epimerase/dehydratase family protein [Nitrospirota bacterium]|nr:NAD-dependent epimerase/dehydratase family protein [Nitrospirota bacterium]
MKCLVTGGAGFIGSHLVDRLLLEGHEVLVVDNLSTGKRANVPKKAKLVKLDVRSPKLVKKMRDWRPQVIFHLAAQISVRESVENPVADADANILGLINVLQSAVEVGCARFYFASSGGACYGEQEQFPATEDHPIRPVSPYGISKAAGEMYLDFFKSRGIQAASMRLANVYGPRQDPHGEAGVVAIFTRQMLKGMQTTINGHGKQTRDFVYVEDVVQAFLIAMIKGLTGPYNVGTGQETEINTLHSVLAQITECGISPKYGPTMDGEQVRSVLGTAKLGTDAEWEVGVSLEEGLKETVNWFRQQKKL